MNQIATARTKLRRGAKNTNEFFGWFMLMKDEIAYPELGFMLVQDYWGFNS